MNLIPGTLNHRAKILIVDDEAPNRRLLEMMLRPEGFLITQACSGEEALAMIAEAPPDLVLTDIIMPGMDGFDIVRTLKGNPATENIPIIIVTSLGDHKTRLLGLATGAEDFLTIPVDRAELYARVRNLLRLKAFGDYYGNYSQLLELEAGLRTADFLESEKRFRQLAEAVNEVFVLRTPDFREVFYVNPAYETIWGRTRESLYAQPWSFREAIHPDDRDRVIQEIEEQSRVGPFDLEYRIVRPDGGERFVRSRGFPVYNEAGVIYRYATIVEDVTETKRAAAALVNSESSYRRLFEAAKDGILILDAQTGTIEDVNPFLTETLGYSRDELLGKELWEIGAFKDIVASKASFVELQRSRYIRYENLPLETKLGKSIFVEFISNAYDVNGRQIIQCNIRDITERKEAEDAARESDTRFRQLAENIREVFYLVNPNMTRMLYVSPAYEEIWGRPRESLYADAKAWTASMHPDDRNRVLAQIAPNGTLTQSDAEYRIVRPDGSERSIRSRTFPIFNAAGEAYRFAGLAEDITDQKHMEEQFRQSQKMDAFGQLAGGVAHDFNNLLTVILGHVAVLEMSALPADEQESVAAIKKSGERAANLTRQLLLFARRQAMHMSRIDVNVTIEETTKMLRRILGEDIQLDFHPSPTPLFALADAGMLDQVLMNLAVNARDAMPDGGRLVIETAAVEFDEESAAHFKTAHRGSFVSLSVSDSGGGIPADILPKIFDPFFTTKDVGRGTGLGLATVFGIMQQHGGCINAYSEGGHGTTFRAYLPAAVGTSANADENAAPAEARRGNETILLVEDEEAIRVLVAAYLTRLGYNVLSAGSAPEAIKIFTDRRNVIHLLLTDLVMPGGMNGIELSGALIAENPDIRVIYTSGYSDSLIGGGLSLTEGGNFLGKPFTLNKVAEIVRFQLDGMKSETGAGLRR